MSPILGAGRAEKRLPGVAADVEPKREASSGHDEVSRYTKHSANRGSV